MGHVRNMIRHIIKWVRSGNALVHRTGCFKAYALPICVYLLLRLIFISLHEDCENSSGADRGKHLMGWE